MVMQEAKIVNILKPMTCLVEINKFSKAGAVVYNNNQEIKEYSGNEAEVVLFAKKLNKNGYKFFSFRFPYHSRNKEDMIFCTLDNAKIQKLEDLRIYTPTERMANEYLDILFNAFSFGEMSLDTFIKGFGFELAIIPEVIQKNKFKRLDYIESGCDENGYFIYPTF